MTLAEEEEQQGDLQTMWEMADVLDFLRVFSRDIPGLSNLEWTANGLESALITSTGGPGLLASIHMVSASCRHYRICVRSSALALAWLFCTGVPVTCFDCSFMRPLGSFDPPWFSIGTLSVYEHIMCIVRMQWWQLSVLSCLRVGLTGASASNVASRGDHDV